MTTTLTIKCGVEKKTFKPEKGSFFKCPFCHLSMTILNGKLVAHGRTDENVDHAVVNK